MRAIPLLGLLALPSAFAAPVPKGVPSPVTSYTAEQLAKLPFVDADTIPEKWNGRGDGPTPNHVALAVTLPKSAYEIGEPVEPLFVLKNRTDKPLDLGFRLDLFDDTPHCVNSARVEIRDADTGKIVGPQTLRSLEKRVEGGSRIPAKGYYAVSGNVGVGAGDKPLPAGKYVLMWRHGWANSNAVEFTVLDQRDRGSKTYRNLRLLRVTETDERTEARKARESETGLNRTWEAAGVAVADPSAATTVLATGQLGRYCPSLRRLPESTKALRAGVRWATTGGAESFTVTVRARDTAAKVSLPNPPFVYLLLECATEPTAEKLRELLRDRIATPGPRIDANHPFKLTVRLPKGWTDEIGASGPARVAVLLSTKELDHDGGLAREVMKRKGEDEQHLLLRTPWHELTLPKTDRRK